MDPVSTLRLRAKPLLEACAEQLRRSHPDVEVTVWDSSTGSLTRYQGHDIGIDCELKHALPDGTSGIALCLGLAHLDRAPILADASVTWGTPSSHAELELIPLPERFKEHTPLAFTDENFEGLMARLPELLDALKKALARGHPPPDAS
ncbi:hypothetical protein [Corallococcus terminator]|uniref:hypothetical protein n=1 Tax=Corallococcus terminator TaxID=2316733 RepID=UPI0011C363F1|nr:hypothetical protein [Corallococcus terminator]